MSPRERLLEELLAERYTNPWWTADTTPTEAEKSAAADRVWLAGQGKIRRVS